MRVRNGGGWRAVLYTFKKAREAGGLWKLWKAMRSRNACKTCALGMGGQSGGMVNESGHFPEVCKKSFQAMVADMQGAVKPEFFATYSIAQLRRFTPYQMEHSGRLVQPVVLEKGKQYYEPISWDDALDRIARRMKGSNPEETFFYFSGRSSNEAGFLLQLFARLYGTNHVNNCSFYCHQASGVGMASVLGTGAGTVKLEDLEQADCVFLIGGNPASNHPRMMRTLLNVRRRGGKVIVVNPIVETGLVNFAVPSDPVSLLFGSRIASTYVQPHVGGDLALVYGLLKRIRETGDCDEAYLAAHTHGWPELAARLDALAWDEIVARSGVTKREIDDVAAQYARSERTVFAWTMGVTHHLHGGATVQAICALALTRGMVGKPGAGLQPIRGHSNIQGLGTVGVTPQLKEAIFRRLEETWGVKLPTMRGFDTLECLDAADAGRMRLAFCLGGNLWGASPDAAYAERALARCDTVVTMSTTLNTGHAGGLGKEETIILPVLARDEEPEPSTQESMFSFVRLSEGGPRRLEGPRAEVEVIADLAERVLGPTVRGSSDTVLDWREMRHTSTIRRAIARIVPGLEAMATIDQTRREFSIPGRALATPVFPTADGRARLFVHELPPPPEGLVLMTIRSEGQFNTVVYEEEDLYRNQTRRDIVLMHPDDVARLGLVNGGRCTVTSDAGEMRGVVVSAFPEIRPGAVAMYYPESNVLVPKAADPLSRTPAYKSVPVTIRPDDARPAPGRAALAGAVPPGPARG
jgi:molybdopterin-dependent oxidoreductase alpha subunit